VEKGELEQFRRPLAERLEVTHSFIEQVRAAAPERMSELLDEGDFRQNGADILFHSKDLLAWVWPRAVTSGQFPAELRARAARHIARQQHTTPRRDWVCHGSGELGAPPFVRPISRLSCVRPSTAASW
jgi:hypothetical protein